MSDWIYGICMGRVLYDQGDSKTCLYSFPMAAKVLGIIVCHHSAFWGSQFDFQEVVQKSTIILKKSHFEPPAP